MSMKAKEHAESKTERQQFKELTGRDADEVFGLNTDAANILERLKIPLRLHRIFAGYSDLEEWEIRAHQECLMFIHARRAKIQNIEKIAAESIGAIISEQLLKGNFSALRIVSEGLLNLQEKKPFKAHAGRKSALDEPRVVTAFYALKAQGIASPSQAEVQRHLAEFDVKIASSKVSKIFDNLGLKSESSDSRDSRTESWKRRRKKEHVSK